MPLKRFHLGDVSFCLEQISNDLLSGRLFSYAGESDLAVFGYVVSRRVEFVRDSILLNEFILGQRIEGVNYKFIEMDIY